MSELGFTRLNLWATGLKVLAVLPSPWQQKCSALHEHPHLIVEVLLMMKHLQYASMVVSHCFSICKFSKVLLTKYMVLWMRVFIWIQYSLINHHTL